MLQHLLSDSERKGSKHLLVSSVGIYCLINFMVSSRSLITNLLKPPNVPVFEVASDNTKDFVGTFFVS